MFNIWRKAKQAVGISTPQQEWLAKYPNGSRTPDANILMQKESWYLFVYGNQMKGFKYNKDLEKGVRVCPAFTRESDMILWNKRLKSNSFPVALNYEDGIRPAFKNMKINGRIAYPAGKIKGELYLLPTYEFFRLDIEGENGVQFNRQRIEVIIPNKTIKRKTLDTEASFREWIEVDPISTGNHLKKMVAYVYLGNPEYWKDQLDDFQMHPVTSYEPLSYKSEQLLGNYYCYSFKECSE